MIELLNSAVNEERNKEFNFYLQGDLSQMSTQRSFLNSKGIQTKQNNVYPCLKQTDISVALRLIWENRVQGWWHYRDNYVLHSICTVEEFNNRLSKC